MLLQVDASSFLPRRLDSALHQQYILISVISQSPYFVQITTEALAILKAEPELNVP